ncbi:response regulator [Iningainema tapete]|uniref:histidine kinase n=1 Tax=Iningainema tapete BLCC-T55 TaxID=2748662 RepID=A0A8J6XNS7_9CYAN|nr:response regulator [Iningainema tapete]MBD2774486.1 response regulator [Iningainema tapete BLCC-T55]
MADLILVVDDDDLTRMQLRTLLEQAGYQVASASNGEQALAVYTRLKPDLVLLDVIMPIMDGISCCAQLRSLPDRTNIPILMITGIYDHVYVEQAFAVGATDYISKPIQWQVLIKRVHRLLEAHHAMAELKQQTEQAQKQETQLRMALAAARMDTWDWDILNNQVTWSSNLKDQLFLEDYSLESFMRCVYPKDREFVKRSVMKTIQTGAEYDIEFRVVWRDGTVGWQACKGFIFRDKNGTPVRMTGVNMDITKRKQAEEELEVHAMRSKLFADITLKIRTSLQIDEVLQTSVAEVQKLLQADRVLIFRLFSDGSGQVVKEAVVPDIPAIIGKNICDPCFQETYIEKYRLGRISGVSNIYQAGIEPCYLKFLQQFSVQAYLVVPILLKNKLWGLLIAYQCTSPREWKSWETELLRQLADQMGIAVAQAQLLEQETRQREELTRSNEELQQFAFIASHDLQEPLRKIKTFGDRLKVSCGDALNEQARDYLERMQNAAKRMQALIEDLLTLSRVTTRAQPFTWVSLKQVTQEVLCDLEVLIQQTKGCVKVNELPIIQADPLQMRQLMQNLVGNALKFHRKQEPPMVKISSKSMKGDDGAELCQIIVEDNGIGFDEKYLDRIFNVFQRLHSRTEYDGTGIGLAICRKIVERHHGNITASSTPEKGARFMITLPINADP